MYEEVPHEIDKASVSEIHLIKKEVGVIHEKLDVYLQLLHKQDVRIALLEQQQKLTMFIYSTLFAILAGVVVKLFLP